MQKVVGYIRVSTTGQAEEGVSLEAQKAKIEAWCNLNDGELVALFEDAGKSGGGDGLFGSIMGLFGKGAASSGSGAVLAGAGNATGADLGMAFVDGASPPLNVPSLVGERGPELFMPTSAGTIIPNSALKGSGSGDSSPMFVNNHFSFSEAPSRKTQDQIALAAGNAVNRARRNA